MKITLFIGGLSGGGAERVTCNLANYMEERGHQVTIVTMADDVPSYYLSADVNRIILLKSNERKFFAYNSVLRLYRLCRYLHKAQTDAYIVMLPITIILLLWVKFFTKAKVIAAERSLPSIYSSRIQKLLRKLAYRADGWVFQTSGQQEWYSNANIKRTIVIPNAINPAFIKPPYNGKRKKIVVTVGSLTKPKNHELLISAFAKFYANHPDYQLIIYGKGYKFDKLQQLAMNLKIEKEVLFPGYTNDVAEKIKDYSVFVLSSDYEGMPNALMEAMAIGLPCISTDCDGGGARFLIDNEKNGLLVPKGDIDALAIAMERMLTDREFAEQCGREAHKICTRLAPDTIYGKWETFIKQVVECD